MLARPRPGAPGAKGPIFLRSRAVQLRVGVVSVENGRSTPTEGRSHGAIAACHGGRHRVGRRLGIVGDGRGTSRFRSRRSYCADGRRRSPAQHRARRHGRLLDGPPVDHAPCQGDAPHRGVLPPLLRRGLTMLPLTCQPPHRAVPAPDRGHPQHRRIDPGHRSERRLRGVPGPRQLRALGQRAPAGVRVHDRLRRQVPQRLLGSDPAAGLVVVASDLRGCLRRLGLQEHCRA